jgi:hypothetical protein
MKNMQQNEYISDAPTSGRIPYAIGLASKVRIPIPGTRGLCIEFKARGWRPVTGSTSTLFFQDGEGKRHLRLDYEYKDNAKAIGYHWNQRGTLDVFNITTHTPAGFSGRITYMAAKYFRFAGPTLLILGASVDIISVVQASKPMRRASEVVAAWAGAWVGCKTAGAGGAFIGSVAGPIGTAVGGVGACIIGGYFGYQVGEAVGGIVYDWSEDTFFRSLPEVRR